MSTHTPAPWMAERGGNITAEGKIIACVQMGQQHNARIIASAPELAEALRNILDACDVNEAVPTSFPGSFENGWSAAHRKLGAYAHAALAKVGL